MKKFSERLPGSELELLWFNYFRKYMCVHAFKLNKLNEEEKKTATMSSFLHCAIFTCNGDTFIQHTENSKFKNIKKRTAIEAQVMH